MAPIRIHPDNPKLFEYRGRPLVLLTATEHYGAVLNRPFRFERYLRGAAANGMTLTRLFTLFRELQTPINPASTCKPASPDYVAPYARTGPGFALDGEPRFDLDRDDPEFYERLHRFIGTADDLGVVVEVVLLSNTYRDSVWRLNPLHADNNVNGLPSCPAPDYLSLRRPALFERQRAHVRRIVAETRRYDNVIYEICNEPGGRAPAAGSPAADGPAASGPTVSEVNDWLAALLREVRGADHPGARRHLIAGQEAFADEPFRQTLDRSYDAIDYDVVNLHPLPATRLRGAEYDLGDFMSKQLRLPAFRDLTLAAGRESKPLNHDEDNVASQYRDPDGWTVHRKRAWVALLCGAHYDVIDFSIQPFLEEGTPDAQAHLRSWFRHLSTYVHGLDLIRSRPLPEALRSWPPGTVAAAFGAPGADYSVYVADAREYRGVRGVPDPGEGAPPSEAGTPGETGTPGEAGAPIGGALVLDLPEAPLAASAFDPTSGATVALDRLRGGPATRIELAPFRHDVVIRLEVIGVTAADAGNRSGS